MKNIVIEGRITRIALRPYGGTSFIRINDGNIEFTEAAALMPLLALTQAGDEVELKFEQDEYFKDAKPVLVRLDNRTLNDVAEHRAENYG